MSRHIIKTRGVVLRLLTVSGASLLLASCATGTVALNAVGQPSLSIDAPLTTVSCTITGACVAIGASGSSSGPTTAAQIRNHKGEWSAVKVPAASLAYFYDGSCAATTCFFSGTQSSGGLLWSINANTGAAAVLRGPAGALVIRNLSCATDIACTTIDQGENDTFRLSTTSDAGVSWSAPRTLTWATNSSIALDCPSPRHCFVATTSTSHVVTLRESTDAGATWTTVLTPTTWTSLTTLSCTASCTALVGTSNGSAVATQTASTSTSASTSTTTTTSTTAWKDSLLTFTASSMACASAGNCLVVGRLNSETPAMAKWRPSGSRLVNLTYVPSVLTDVACSSSACVAIAVTTVVSIRP